MSAQLGRMRLTLGSNPATVLVPPRSPFGLIQEDLWPDEWKILISCMMLNCTNRKQVEKVLPTFFTLWPDPESFLSGDREQIIKLCHPLGFSTRRTDNMLKMTRAFLGDWKHALELPGIGVYGARAWEMFCKCDIGKNEPKDGALCLYWRWATKQEFGREK
jgi:methyl-CpG-binding domain protein 4